MQVIAIFCHSLAQEGQSDEWVVDYKTALNTVVKINLEKDPDFVEANKEKVQTFERQSCLSNCSGNGVCTEEGMLIYPCCLTCFE